MMPRFTAAFLTANSEVSRAGSEIDPEELQANGLKQC
jgi:hypothetical protein